MSKINAKGQLSGVAGPVYFRVLNGKPIAQSMPRKHKKAAATQANASEFGLASKTSKSIRTMLYPILQDMSDTMMYKRFVAIIHRIIKSNDALPKSQRSLMDGELQLLEGFEFNETSPLGNYCSVLPTIAYEGQVLTVSFPEFSNSAIKAPPKATGTTIGIHVSVIDTVAGVELHAEQFRIEVANTNGTTNAIIFTTATIPIGHLVLVTAALFFYRDSSLSGRVTLNSRALHPCVILGAGYGIQGAG